MEPLTLGFRVIELAQAAPSSYSWKQGEKEPNREATSIKAVASFLDNNRTFHGSLHIKLPNDSGMVPQIGEYFTVTITKEK